MKSIHFFFLTFHILRNLAILIFVPVRFRSRDLKQMNTRQAKISMLTAKEVKEDKTLRTKGDKDRRLREKKQNNTKKFMEERKTLQVGKDENVIKKRVSERMFITLFTSYSLLSLFFFSDKTYERKRKIGGQTRKTKARSR